MATIDRIAADAQIDVSYSPGFANMHHIYTVYLGQLSIASFRSR